MMVVPPRAILVTADLLQERALVCVGERVIRVTTMNAWGKMHCWGSGLTTVGGEESVGVRVLEGLYGIGPALPSKIRSQSRGNKLLN